MLSLKEILPSTRVSPSKITDNPKGTKFHSCVLEGPVRYRHETPKIRAIFEIFEPIAVPRAISSFSLIMLDIPTNISGAEVPKAIRVSPITKSLIPICLAITDA